MGVFKWDVAARPEFRWSASRQFERLPWSVDARRSEFVQCFQLLILAVRFDKRRRLEYTEVLAVDIHYGLCNSLSGFLVDISNMRVSPGRRHKSAIMLCYITWHCSICEVTQKTAFPQRG